MGVNGKGNTIDKWASVSQGTKDTGEKRHEIKVIFARIIFSLFNNSLIRKNKTLESVSDKILAMSLSSYMTLVIT